MTKEFTIREAWLSDAGASPVLIAECVFTDEDESGQFENWTQFDIPLRISERPATRDIGGLPFADSLPGKKLTITVEGME